MLPPRAPLADKILSTSELLAAAHAITGALALGRLLARAWLLTRLLPTGRLSGGILPLAQIHDDHCFGVLAGGTPQRSAAGATGSRAAADDEHMHAALLRNLLELHGLPVAHRRDTNRVLRVLHHETGHAVEAVVGAEHHGFSGLSAHAASLAGARHSAGSILLSVACRSCASTILLTADGPGGLSAIRASRIAPRRPGLLGALACAGDENDLKIAAFATAGHLRLADGARPLRRDATGRSTAGHATHAARRGIALLHWEQHDHVRGLPLLKLDGRGPRQSLLYPVLPGALTVHSGLLLSAGLLTRTILLATRLLARPILLAARLRTRPVLLPTGAAPLRRGEGRAQAHSDGRAQNPAAQSAAVQYFKNRITRSHKGCSFSEK